MSAAHGIPPRLAQWILSHSVSPEIRYGAMGDFEQIYSEITETDGRRRADAWYWRQVVRSLPFFISDTIIWTLIMFKNYLFVAYRNLYKNKASSIVNVTGLSLAVASAILSFLFIENTYTRDWFHENADNIFLVENYISRGQDNVQLRGDTPLPLGPAMETEIPQVKRAVRIFSGEISLQRSDNTFQESVWYADPDILDMFSFRLRLGDKSAPIGHDDIILNDALATKYFGDENPIGKELTVIFSDTTSSTFLVKGVAAPFSPKASFRFSAVIHIDHLKVLDIDETDWSYTTRATFIELQDPSDIELIAAQMEGFRVEQNETNPDRAVTEFLFANLRTVSAKSYAVSGDISGGSHPAAVIILGLVGLFMLLLSCINYMNLAIAAASRRLKEIGVRKALGSSKAQLVTQFLTENLLVCTLSTFAGIAIAYFLFIPGFNSLFADGGVGLSIRDADTGFLWGFLAVLLISTALISGAYPAFYISSFRPTAIFRGRADLGSENFFTRGLLTFQFVLAFLTMIMGVVMVQNSNYQASRDWGYTSDHLLVLRVQDSAEYDVLLFEIDQLPGVQDIVGARNHFRQSRSEPTWSEPTIQLGDDRIVAARFDVGDGFLDMYDVAIISGKGFGLGSNTAIDRDVIVNKTFAESRGWTPDTALGQSFRQDSVQYSIAGVVGDFIYRDFYDIIEPAFLTAVLENEYRFMTVKVTPGMGVETEAAVHDVWRKLMPDQEYNAFFQDTVFQEALRENKNIKTIFSFIAGMALIIACMGLFGLAAQKVARQMREISIRKVLGASIPHLAKRMNRSFLFIILLAAIIASPLGYISMTALLGSIYDDPYSIGPSTFIVAFSFVLGTATLTILTQLRKLIRANPAEVLRSE